MKKEIIIMLLAKRELRPHTLPGTTLYNKHMRFQ